jgi:glycerophosphoryl diester phosphodiesterase
MENFVFINIKLMAKNIIPFLLLIFGCAGDTQQASMEKQVKQDGIFDLQGHRGCRGLFPENTISAMLRALELGVTTLEMDAVITADSMVVLSHEPFFNHEISRHPDGRPVTEAEEKSLNIYQMTYEEVKRFDVGMQPHPRFPEQEKMPAYKPLLSDVIQAVKTWCAENEKPLPFFNIETKCLPQGDNRYHPGPERFVDLLVGVLESEGISNKTIIQSFDFRTLKYARKKYPELALAALVEEDDKGTMQNHLDDLGFVPEIYSPAWQRVDEVMVRESALQGMKVIPWTVNDTAPASKLKALGVQGLITDYPNRVR